MEKKTQKIDPQKLQNLKCKKNYPQKIIRLKRCKKNRSAENYKVEKCKKSIHKNYNVQKMQKIDPQKL